MATKHISRREFLGLAAGLGSAALLAACGPTPTPQTVEVEKVVTKEVEKVVKETVEVEKVVKETVVVQATPAGPQITVLTVAHAWEAAFEATQEKWDNAFTEKHPDIFIKRVNSEWGAHNQIVPTWAAAGELPDIIYVHGSRALPWNHEGIMVSIQDFVDADAEFDVKGVWEEALKLYRYKGKLYEIPYDHGPVILGFNKDLFDAGGVKYPDDTWTWDDFLAAAKKLTKEGEQWGYSGYYGGVFNMSNEYGIALVGPWGGQVFNDDDTKLLIDSPESKAGLQFFADLIHVHKVATTQAEATAFPEGVWIAGRAAMFALATWGTPQMAEFASFKYDVAPWPKGPKGRKTGSFGSGYGVTKDSKHPDKGWAYLREYLSKQGMEDMWGKSGRGSPARKAAYDSWLKSEVAPEHAQYYLDALENYAVTGHPYLTLGGGEILDVLNQNATLVQTGDITIEEFVQKVMSDGTPVLEKAAQQMQG
jgi:multiple sugar transport system substrate-binding protein